MAYAKVKRDFVLSKANEIIIDINKEKIFKFKQLNLKIERYNQLKWHQKIFASIPDEQGWEKFHIDMLCNNQLQALLDIKRLCHATTEEYIYITSKDAAFLQLNEGE